MPPSVGFDFGFRIVRIKKLMVSLGLGLFFSTSILVFVSFYFLIRTIIMLGVDGGFGSPVRRLIRGHAFLSTVLNEIRNEVVQQQLTSGVAHSDALVYHLPQTVHEWITDFAHTGLYAGVVIGIFCAAELYNNWTSLQKFLEFAEYTDFRKRVRVFIVVFFGLFFRVVDNAI